MDPHEQKDRIPETMAASPGPGAKSHLAEQERQSEPGSLSRQEGLYRQIFETLQAPVVLVEPETGRILDGNAAAAAFYGSSVEELRRVSLWDLNALTQEELFRELIQSATRSHRVFVLRQRLLGGDVRDVEIGYNPIRTREKTLFSALLRDITKQAEQDDLSGRTRNLREAVTEALSQLLTQPGHHAGLKRALEGFSTVQGLSRLDLYGTERAIEGHLLVSHLWQWRSRTKEFEPGDARMRGIPLGDLVPFGIDDLKKGLPLVCPVQSLSQPFRAILETDAGIALVIPAVTEDALRALLVVGDTVPDNRWSDKELDLFSRFASSLAGIYAREGANEELRRTADQYRALVESSADVLFQTDATGLWTLLSPSWTDLTGFAVKESIGDFCLSNVHHDDRQAVALDFQSLLEGRTPAVQCQMRLVRKDGSARAVRLLARPLRDDTGRVTSTTGFLQDVGSRPAVSTTPQEDRYQRLFEGLNDVIFVATPEGRLLDINRAAIEALRYSSKDELLSRNVYADIFADARDGQRFSAELERSGAVRDFDINVKTKDGEALTLSISAVRTSDPSLIMYQGIGRDVTRRRKQEQEVLFTKKMEAVGQLAGGVAHDFNNILTGIRGYAEILRAKLSAESGLTSYVDRIISSSERGAHITEGLMTFSRKRKAKTERLEIDEIIENSRPLLAKILGGGIQVVLRTSGKKPQVTADCSQLEQVLMHLATNARDAMPQGGVFTVASDVVRLGTEFRKLHGYGEPGTFVRISVTDTGTGMDAKTREKAFEPFFTTREVGKGSGLGLSIVYGIVKQHQGYITVRSAPGEGSTFEIYLPLAVQREEIVKPTDFPVPRGGSETILLAEDDEVVNDLLRSILEGFGYCVISAVDGEDAVAKFRENRDRVNLLLSDLVMPRKTGQEIYEEIRSLRPDLKVIFISGYDEDIARGKGVAEKGFPVIPKPFSTSDLLNRVRAVLDEQPVA